MAKAEPYVVGAPLAGTLDFEQPKKKRSTGSYVLTMILLALVAFVAYAALVPAEEQETEDGAGPVITPVDTPLTARDLSCDLGDLQGRFATKTVYQNRIPLTERTDLVSGEAFPTFLQGGTCELSRVYFLARHGTRFPTDGSTEEMQEFGFNMDMDFLDEGLLLRVGKEELFGLGQRFRARYENLTGEEIVYHPRIYDFNSSAKVRALESGEAFARGFFENGGSASSILGDTPIIAIKSLDEDSDPYLRFHSTCPLKEFQEDREDAEGPQAQIDALGEKYKPILEEHFASLNIDGDILDYAIVLYNACPFEQALGCVNKNGNTDYTESACELMNNETVIEILEYLADAEDYYFAGLGDQVNMDMSCVMRNEIVDFLNGLSTEIPEMKYRFGFAHSETILPLVAHLNFSFYQDSDEVLENNLFTVERELFTDEVLNRNWRASVHSPLANNLVFEKYDCDGEEMIAILHNELLVFEGTEAEFLEVSNYFDEECDLEVYCALPEGVVLEDD